ncbi:diguanylate cyclase [Klebsiella pneumoniae]
MNDNFGHSEGNEVLCNFADMLEDLSSSKSVVARLGGDEFGVLLPSQPIKKQKNSFIN